MSEDARIAWKTDAWKNSGMVAGYARAISSDAGTNVIKNRIETGLIQKFLRGTDILDVGVGTGRASLPLARNGKCVTGVDSSQAMLEKCAEEAQGIPMRLLIGDVAELPFEDASFDTVMGLNTVAHFPHWKHILREWRRVVRAGGEVLFDMHSLDHDIAFARATGHDREYALTKFAPVELSRFHQRLEVEELVGFAAEIGLSVRAIVPYGAFFGRSGVHRFMDGTLLSGRAWDRLLSWAAADKNLFEFVCFLEEEIVGRLPSTSTGRFFAVFDAIDRPEHNSAWIERNRDANGLLSKGLLSALLELSGADVGRVRSLLNGFLGHEPNRFLLARMFLAKRKWNWAISVRDWIDDPYATQIEHALNLGSLNDVVMAILESFSQVPEVAQAFDYRGFPLAKIMEYDLIGNVLNDGCHAFNSTVTGD